MELVKIHKLPDGLCLVCIITSTTARLQAAKIWGVRRVLLLGFVGLSLHAQTGENVLLVVNGNVALSRQIADYYRPRRSVPVKNVCTIATTGDEEIQWNVYESQIERPIGDCLKKAGLVDKVLYIVTTMGVPLKVDGPGARQLSERASVDSELTLLYAKLKGARYSRTGGVPNPFFMQRDAPFRHSAFPIYLVTRLAAYDLADVKAMIDRSLQARNRGKFVIDLQSEKNDPGNNWLRTAAMLLPAARVVLDETTRPLYDQTDVIGYASWGSNDDHRTQRLPALPVAARRHRRRIRLHQRADLPASARQLDAQRQLVGQVALFRRKSPGADRRPHTRRRHRSLRQRLRAFPAGVCASRLPPAGLQSGAQPGRILLPFPDLPELAKRHRGRPAVRAEAIAGNRSRKP